jgi:uncharacterized membrane protein
MWALWLLSDNAGTSNWQKAVPISCIFETRVLVEHGFLVFYASVYYFVVKPVKVIPLNFADNIHIKYRML